VIPKLKRQQIMDLLSSVRRVDGRGLEDLRPVEIRSRSVKTLRAQPRFGSARLWQ
jgi:exosome complex RNA-binding protein Rrp42 (RNase PH superfamily)